MTAASQRREAKWQRDDKTIFDLIDRLLAPLPLKDWERIRLRGVLKFEIDHELGIETYQKLIEQEAEG